MSDINELKPSTSLTREQKNVLIAVAVGVVLFKLEKRNVTKAVTKALTDGVLKVQLDDTALKAAVAESVSSALRRY